MTLLEKIEFGSEFDAFESSKLITQKRLSKEQIQKLSNIAFHGKESHNMEAATYALSFSDYENRKRVLVELIKIINAKTLPESVRGQAAEGIGLVKPDNRNKISKIAEKSLFLNLKDLSPIVRFWCCYAFGSWGLKNALSALYNLRKNDHSICQGWWYVSEEAADAIERIKGRHGKERIPVSRRNNTEPDV